MKYFIAARPGPMPPSPEQFDAAIEWLDAKVQDGTFDCIFGFIEGAASASPMSVRAERGHPPAAPLRRIQACAPDEQGAVSPARC